MTGSHDITIHEVYTGFVVFVSPPSTFSLNNNKDHLTWFLPYAMAEILVDTCKDNIDLIWARMSYLDHWDNWTNFQGHISQGKREVQYTAT